ncbi:STOP protein (macronuclear) [Tetrahymena thermophila SB210]|uniref:STOP protein n=1 Tax=Tetrahymena thermophila (strain SB210) TaxID=312017 RepID=I7MI81_TETTS|nr:STOP protein [Tetrahymena thermophila SB210]EAR90974.2 STOP protein [Tetrahymena thermophila SB210]|eukprot:XP_001011219.2 STOP protein [Tetrahymena thermophila SB210]
MQSVDVQQLLQPSEYSVIAAKKTVYRPRSSYQNGPRNNTLTKINKMDLSAADDYKTPEKVNKRLVLKHFGGTSQERIRQRRANSQVNYNMTYSGFYPHKDHAALPLNQQRVGNSSNKTQEINHRQDSQQPRQKNEGLKKAISFERSQTAGEGQKRKRSTTSYQNQRPNDNTQQDYYNPQNANDTLKGFYSSQQTDIDDNGNPCFKIDYSFLDNISLDDPRLQKILNDDALNSKQFDLESIIDENADYFHHLFGNCACIKCTCGRCRCQHGRMKVIYRNGFTTSYAQHFPEKKKIGVTPPLNQTFYESLSSLQRTQINIDPSHLTTHKRDYIGHEPQPREKKSDFNYTKTPFMASSHYKTNFLDWKDYDPSYVFKRPVHNSVATDCPMRTKTTYNDNFLNKDKIQNATADDVKRLQKNQTLPNSYQDDKPTEYNKSFQNFNPKEVPNTKLPFKYISETEKFQSVPPWKTQYKTINQNDFKNPKVDICPTSQNGMTKPWKLKLIQKLKQLGLGETSNTNISQNSKITKRLAKTTTLPHRY